MRYIIICMSMLSATFLVGLGLSQPVTPVTPQITVVPAWTPTEIVSLVGAVGVVLTIVFAGIVNVIMATMKKKVEEMAADTKVTLGHVNSAATKSDALITSLEAQVTVQASAIAKLEQAAALVAQATALSQRVPISMTPAPAPPAPVGTIAAVTEAAKTIVDAVPQLDSIEKTGEATHGIVTEIKGKP